MIRIVKGVILIVIRAFSGSELLTSSICVDLELKLDRV